MRYCTQQPTDQQAHPCRVSQYYERLYTENDDVPVSTSVNIDALLQQEVTNLKDTSKQVFRPIHTSLNDLVFISMTDNAGMLWVCCGTHVFCNTPAMAQCRVQGWWTLCKQLCGTWQPRKQSSRGAKSLVVIIGHHATHIAILRHCLRLIPVEAVCDASVEAIGKAAESLVSPHFPPEGPCVPFACVLECRATKHLKKLDVINAAIQGIPQVCGGFC